MTPPLRVVFMGTAEFACPSLAALDDAPGIEVITVFTQPNRPKGRQLIPQPPPVKLEAESHQLPVHQPECLRDDSQLLEQLDPGLIVVTAYGQILPQTILDLPPHGCLNVHGSLLPAYRGAAPIQRALLEGQAETGVTIMQMDAGLDTGAMLAKGATTIGPDDNAQTLHDRLAKLGAGLLLETIPRHVAGDITPEPQDETLATHAAKITRDMGRIDWSLPATRLWNQARAFTPWPGLYTHLGGKRLKLLEVEPAEATGHEPGRVGQSDANGIVIGCGDGVLRITRLQKEGAKPLAAAEFLAGTPLPVGTQLG
ncbi:MAG: methionyl-tRNA formyltransferase [Verrucomicrobiota bacterium]|nr:methionyl-tRNA formyltransferase [Verrucomicrobiota bacterium]MDP7048981.1 methionyl-tRNA formyltransferase [Verrucomicrobiota bacterium]